MGFELLLHPLEDFPGFGRLVVVLHDFGERVSGRGVDSKEVAVREVFGALEAV